MKYYHIVNERTSHGFIDEHVVGKTDDIFEAMSMARAEWDSLTDYDKKYTRVSIRHYLHDIDNENCECFDFDEAPEAWYWWFAVTTDDDKDYGHGSFDWYEAYIMACEVSEFHPDKEVFITTVDYRDSFCVDEESLEEIKRNMNEY